MATLGCGTYRSSNSPSDRGPARNISTTTSAIRADLVDAGVILRRRCHPFALTLPCFATPPIPSSFLCALVARASAPIRINGHSFLKSSASTTLGETRLRTSGDDLFVPWTAATLHQIIPLRLESSIISSRRSWKGPILAGPARQPTSASRSGGRDHIAAYKDTVPERRPQPFPAVNSAPALWGRIARCSPRWMNQSRHHLSPLKRQSPSLGTAHVQAMVFGNMWRPPRVASPFTPTRITRTGR